MTRTPQQPPISIVPWRRGNTVPASTQAQKVNQYTAGCGCTNSSALPARPVQAIAARSAGESPRGPMTAQANHAADASASVIEVHRCVPCSPAAPLWVVSPHTMNASPASIAARAGN